MYWTLSEFQFNVYIKKTSFAVPESCTHHLNMNKVYYLFFLSLFISLLSLYITMWIVDAIMMIILITKVYTGGVMLNLMISIVLPMEALKEMRHDEKDYIGNFVITTHLFSE